MMQPYPMKSTIVLAAAAAFFCSPVSAKPCYNRAVQRYNKGGIQLVAPFNSVRVIRRDLASINCEFTYFEPIDHAMKISCNDGYRYEVGTTPWCLKPGEHTDIRKKCGKAIVIAPDGTKTYHITSEVFKKESCIPGGGQLQIGDKIFGVGNDDPLIVTTLQFRAP